MAHTKDYTDYIESNAWYAKRKLAFEYHGKHCKKCGATKPLHVHHKTYKNFKNEDIENDLVPLCERCHARVHKFCKKHSIDLLHGTDQFLALKEGQKFRRKRRNQNERLRKQWTETNKTYKWVPRSPDMKMEDQQRRLSAYKKQQPRPPKLRGGIDYAKMATQYGITIEEARAIAG